MQTIIAGLVVCNYCNVDYNNYKAIITICNMFNVKKKCPSLDEEEHAFFIQTCAYKRHASCIFSSQKKSKKKILQSYLHAFIICMQHDTSYCLSAMHRIMHSFSAMHHTSCILFLPCITHHAFFFCHASHIMHSFLSCIIHHACRFNGINTCEGKPFDVS